METIVWFRWLAIGVMIAAVWPTHSTWQVHDAAGPTPNNELAARVARLEARVQELETILIANLHINVLDAERRVNEARRRLQASRELFFKGLLTEFQFQHDQFELDRAERELQILRDPHHHQAAMTELELRDAERRLEEARYRARFSESLLLRGYMTPGEAEQLRQAVETAEKQLAAIREKLAAAQRLENLDRPPVKDPPEDKRP